VSAKSDIAAETRLWLAQRVSAGVLAVCVVVHLATMVAAVQGGLSTAEIAGRVGGSAGWLAFYSLFILAAAVHAPIGMRAVLAEMTQMPKERAGLLAGVFALFLAVLGLRAVFGLYQLGGGG
jgi:fumarate reductase subunit C